MYFTIILLATYFSKIESCSSENILEWPKEQFKILKEYIEEQFNEQLNKSKVFIASEFENHVEDLQKNMEGNLEERISKLYEKIKNDTLDMKNDLKNDTLYMKTEILEKLNKNP